MKSAAINFTREDAVEERLARVEAHVEHIQADVTEIKGDIRRLDAKVDQSRTELRAEVGVVRTDLNTKIDLLRGEIASAKLWALTLYIAQAGALLAVLAKGFGWI